MPAKPLSPAQKADAQRLKASFVDWQNAEKRAGRPWSQDAFADHLDFGQSALNQYLNGTIPLNPVVLAKMCELLRVDTAFISPSIAGAQLEEIGKWTASTMRAMETSVDYKVSKLPAPPWPFKTISLAEVQALDPITLRRLETTIRHRIDELLADLAQPQKPKTRRG